MQQLLAGLILDGILATLCYVAAYRLRFDPSEFQDFFPTALRSLPLVVGCQLSATALLGTYAHRQGRKWLPRLISGVIAGTAAAAGLIYLWLGYQGVSRAAFAVDAVLLVILAFAWRGALGLWRLLRVIQAPAASLAGMDDRADAASDSVSAGLIGLLRYRELLRSLVLKDLKLKYRGSALGFLWSLVNPLVMIAVYSVAFTFILRIRTEAFVFFLLLGILPWTFFAGSAGMSTGAIVDSSGLIKGVAFPRIILPIATVLFNFAQFVLTIAVFLPVMLLAYGVAPVPQMLVFPAFVLLQVLFTAGVALLLASSTVFFRDVRHLLEIGLSFMFWTTPIVYEFRNLPELARTLILLSPLSSFVVAYQQIFYYRQWPDVSLWLAAVTYAIGAFVLGATAFVSLESRFAELT